MQGLKGKVAIVTGALGDIGHAGAARGVEEGCQVAIFDAADDTEGPTWSSAARTNAPAGSSARTRNRPNATT